MSCFKESLLRKRLVELDKSQQSIETLSLWLLHHRKHYEAIVKIWYEELVGSKPSQKMKFIYLANDIIHKSRKKSPEYVHQFGLYIKQALENLNGQECDDVTKKKICRILQIWDDRKLYDSETIKDFRKGLGVPCGSDNEYIPESKNVNEDFVEPQTSDGGTAGKKDVDYTQQKTLLYSPKMPKTDQPILQKIILSLSDLDNCTVSHLEVKEILSKVELEEFDVRLTPDFTDRPSAENFLQKVESAVHLLENYSNRVEIEIHYRKLLVMLLEDCLKVQTILADNNDEKRAEIKKKLEQILPVKDLLTKKLAKS